MRRYRYLMIVSILIILIGISYYFITDTSKLHEQIDVNDVEAIRILRRTNRIADQDEINDIINWFNAITEVRQNKHFAGTTSESSILIELKNGNTIHILNSGSDFEVQRKNRSGKLISYWGKQSNIRDLLYNNSIE